MWGLRKWQYFLPEIGVTLDREEVLGAVRKAGGAPVQGTSTLRHLGRRGSIIAGAGKGSEL